MPGAGRHYGPPREKIFGKLTIAPGVIRKHRRSALTGAPRSRRRRLK